MSVGDLRPLSTGILRAAAPVVTCESTIHLGVHLVPSRSWTTQRERAGQSAWYQEELSG